MYGAYYANVIHVCLASDQIKVIGISTSNTSITPMCWEASGVSGYPEIYNKWRCAQPLPAYGHPGLYKIQRYGVSPFNPSRSSLRPWWPPYRRLRALGSHRAPCSLGSPSGVHRHSHSRLTSNNLTGFSALGFTSTT